MKKIKEACVKVKYHSLFQDWKANRGNFKSKIILIFYRLAAIIRRHMVLTVIFFWYLIIYRVLIEWLLNFQINWFVQIGKNLKVTHGHGLIIEASVVIGNNCVLRHSTTIGCKTMPDGTCSRSPRIGNNVNIGSGVIIIGDIVIGDNAIIGAGTVITKSVARNAVMVGNPARLLKMSYTHKTII